MKKLLIRASSLGKIMSDNPGVRLTEKQNITLNDLLSKIKLTKKQSELRDSLLLKRDAPPELSKGGKSYMKQLWLENNYDIKQEINSKYIDKGNEVESLSIKLAELTTDLGELYKNNEYFENDFVCGTPDVITDTHIIDVKSSWSAATFPFFEEKIPNTHYVHQLKAYMWLTNIHKSYLTYCLVPTPEILIQDEIKRTSWKRGEIEISDETEEEVRQFHNLDKIPIWERVKSFELKLTGEDIKDMKEKVTLARKYYKSLK
jgi:hypothetical protein|tara:strand:- start:12957 stop:13736 length:780 start_codon:yes stop_codon:yes gene_type:complete